MADYPPIYVSNSNKYVLSLDAIDLCLLPTEYQPQLINNNAVLWSPNQKNEYFEFEIKSVQNSERQITEDDKNENEAHIVCHICKTLVPRAYVKDHINSLKHISYQNIATTAMNRVAVKNSLIEDETIIKNNRDYFCDHCVTIVNISNRVDHEQSKKHKNFVALDTFLNNFALFYTNTDDNVDETVSELVKYECVSSNTEISFVKVNKKLKVNEVGTDNALDHSKNNQVVIETPKVMNKECTDVNTKLKEASNLINNIKSCIDNTQDEVNNNTTDLNSEEANIVNNLKQYINLVKRYGEVKLEALHFGNQDHLRIKTMDGCEVIVSVNNFHGFKRTGKKYVQCKLCKVFVSNINDHIVSEKHIHIIAKSLENQHCLRQLDDTHIHHCVICNEVINNPEIHVLFNEHTKKLEQALSSKINSNTSKNTVDTQASHDKLCVLDVIKNELTAPTFKSTDTNIQNNPSEDFEELCVLGVVKNESTAPTFKNTDTNIQSNVANNIEGSENAHKNENIELLKSPEYFCDICNKYMHVRNIDTHKNGTKHVANANKIFMNYLMKRNNDTLICRICDVNVSKFTWAVQDHIALPDHITKYYKVLAENKINECDDSFFCKPCSATLHKMSELYHISTQNHQVKLASYNINYIASMDQQKLIESIKKAEDEDCNKSRSTASCTEDVDKETTSERNTLYQCDACNEQLDNNPDVIKLHNESANHKIRDDLLSKVNKLLEELLKHFNNPPELNYQLERGKDSELKCKICPYVTVEDAEKHINNLKHVRNRRNLMEANKLKLNKDRYVCHVCNVYVQEGKELSHIETDIHTQRIDSLKNGDYVLVSVETRKLMEKMSSELKVLESKRDSAARALEFGDFIPWNKRLEFNIKNGDHFSNLIDNDREIICVLCQVVIEKTEKEIALHTNELVHKLNHKDVMVYNQIYRIKNGFVCGFCECVFYGSEFDHIMDLKHEDNFIKCPKKNFCFKCNVSILDNAGHLTSPEHIEKIISSPALHYCNICNFKLANSGSNIQRHEDGFQHKNNCVIIEQNRLILKNKKCFCQVCESSFSRDGLESHIGESNHQSMLLGEHV